MVHFCVLERMVDVSDIKAGVVLVSKFITKEKIFQGYIDYIDRDEATRNANMEKFNDYMEYMGNPDKTTEIFTNSKDALSQKEKKELKKMYRQAKGAGNLMWQTVISFDNEWLSELNVYDKENKVVDSVKLKELTRRCMDRMLKNEGIDSSAFWSAAIHYNTDNIHIHIATSELNSLREKKLLELVRIDKNWVMEQDSLKKDYNVICRNRRKKKKYVDRKFEGKFIQKLKETLSVTAPDAKRIGKWLDVNKDGDLIVSYTSNRKKGNWPEFMKVESSKMEYWGQFKNASFNMGKREIVNGLLNVGEQNQKINDIIRNNILQNKKNIFISQDEEFKKMFIKVYSMLPKDKRQWNYASNTLGDSTRNQIDKLSRMFLDKYFQEDMKELKGILSYQNEQYARAYGGSDNTEQFTENKMKDLYKRLGNAILNEMKMFDGETKRMRNDRSPVGNGGHTGSKNRTHHKKNHFGQKKWENRTHDISREVGQSLRILRRRLEKEVKNYKNQAVYQQIQQEIDWENSELQR